MVPHLCQLKGEGKNVVPLSQNIIPTPMCSIRSGRSGISVPVLLRNHVHRRYPGKVLKLIGCSSAFCIIVWRKFTRKIATSTLI